MIQTNRGPYYCSRHPRSDTIWRDFYYATMHTALTEINDRWAADDITLSHPTGHDWPQDLVVILQEVVRHLNDVPKQTLERIHLDCLHGLTEQRLEEAADAIASEEKRGALPAHRELRIEAVDLAMVGAPETPGAVMRKITL